MHPYLSGPCYRRLFVQRREAALDELPLMFEGLWPEASDKFLREAEEDIDQAWSVAELTSVLRTWAQFLREHAQNPEFEARGTLLPLFSSWAADSEVDSSPWG